MNKIKVMNHAQKLLKIKEEINDLDLKLKDEKKV